MRIFTNCCSQVFLAMKFLSVIAASLAAFSAAQEQQKPSSFRGKAQDKFNQQKNRWSQQKGGQKKGGQDGKSKGACSVANIPEDQLDKLATQFKALDVNDDGSLDAKEFEDEEAKISEAFSSYRKGQKPSWYKGRKGGRGGDKKSGDKPSRGDRPGRGDRPSRGDKSNRGDKNGGKGKGKRQLADGDISDFMEYLRQKGFVTGQKRSQQQKDQDEAKSAGQVFRKFDRDGNDQITLCEYENAMYRTQMMEKMMRQKGGDDSVVVVKDH